MRREQLMQTLAIALVQSSAIAGTMWSNPECNASPQDQSMRILYGVWGIGYQDMLMCSGIGKVVDMCCYQHHLPKLVDDHIVGY
jgi:hypothetical protein